MRSHWLSLAAPSRHREAPASYSDTRICGHPVQQASPGLSALVLPIGARPRLRNTRTLTLLSSSLLGAPAWTSCQQRLTWVLPSSNHIKDVHTIIEGQENQHQKRYTSCVVFAGAFLWGVLQGRFRLFSFRIVPKTYKEFGDDGAQIPKNSSGPGEPLQRAQKRIPE